MNGARIPDSPVAADSSPRPITASGAASIDRTRSILHYTGMPTGAQALAWLCDPASEVSSHYFVWEDGRVVQLVPEDRRAWHAGRGLGGASATSIPRRSASRSSIPATAWRDAAAFPERADRRGDRAAARHRARGIGSRPNGFSPIPTSRPAASAIPASGFRGTRWRAPGSAIGRRRPPCGGPELRRGEEGAPIRALQAMLALYGYGLDITGVYDAPTRDVVAAFQRHFRPARVDGQADGFDHRNAARLARRPRKA